ncbi:MAG: leucine-rich repeat protein, partial [Bacteroidales bacterium]|nr:leucine-rich repeat protein [Bacteroidales bacterium]
KLTSIMIPDGVTYIGTKAFASCKSLTSITIPEGVEYIGTEAFSETAASEDRKNWDGDVFYIGRHLIKARTSVAGHYAVKPGTKRIEDEAFRWCGDLISVTIPESVTSIGNDAFYDCENLASITIPEGVTSIGDGAFRGCKSLTSITIPEGVMSIGDGTVISKGWGGGGGNTVKIRHNSVYTTAYLHLSRYANIKVGDRVSQGQVIGYVGMTGTATGPHLDFRVWKNGSPINPLKMESPSAEPLAKEFRPALDSTLALRRQELDSLSRTQLSY